MNELLFILGAIIVFSSSVLINRFFGKEGLFSWIAISIILANLVVAKQVTVFGIDITLGNIMFANVFLCTDILTENYGVAYAKKAVFIALLSNVLFIGTTVFALLFVPNSFDFATSPMNELFAITTRTTLASVTMFFIANMLDVYIFNGLKNKFPKSLWFRNNVATIICNCGENFLFTFAAFYKLIPNSDLVIIAISTCIVEIILALCDTPFVYLATKKSLPTNLVEE